ncbi:hypothetical protein HYFRA_00012589 [Hymenoscyphus fraxineus]|uniref:Uncharacterized protein n=1 Tax=Hymenoscyphus fraxineus TaxID=746836 RepID=A0A9N9L3F8_9HELO|nr:hypothetical protein HYFRA_00012589 [Hymenoscyphus fraxineus]
MSLFKVGPPEGVLDPVRAGDTSGESLEEGATSKGETSSYTEATYILAMIFESTKTPLEISTRAALRLCKLARRMQKSSAEFDEWSYLRSAVQSFDVISDALKYEVLEEVVCYLSVLTPEDCTKVPQLPYIVRTLTEYRTGSSKGSSGFYRNFLNNIAALRQFKKDLGVLCHPGPERFAIPRDGIEEESDTEGPKEAGSEFDGSGNVSSDSSIVSGIRIQDPISWESNGRLNMGDYHSGYDLANSST